VFCAHSSWHSSQPSALQSRDGLRSHDTLAGEKHRRCRPPETLKFGSFPKLLAALAASGPPTGDLMVELDSLRWIEALPIAVLVAYLRDHQVRNPGSTNTIRVPAKYEYLQRMDFFRAVGARLPEKFVRRDPTGRFVPVRQIANGTEVARAAQDIVETLQVDDEDAARVLRHCVGELLDNVFVHSQSRVNAVVCAQHFPNAKRSQVAIVDTGIGFLGSFSETALFEQLRLDERAALRLGLAPFVTSKPPTGVPYESGYARLGVGLYIVSELLDLIGGRILVVSGRAAVDRRKGRHIWSNVPSWRGTIVGFEMPDEPGVSYEVALRRARESARRLQREREGKIS
jgi:hypothetical protein